MSLREVEPVFREQSSETIYLLPGVVINFFSETPEQSHSWNIVVVDLLQFPPSDWRENPLSLLRF